VTFDHCPRRDHLHNQNPSVASTGIRRGRRAAGTHQAWNRPKARHPVRRVLELTGLDKLLPVYPSARHAAAAGWIAPPGPACRPWPLPTAIPAPGDAGRPIRR
jgi:hypothetical protein